MGEGDFNNDLFDNTEVPDYIKSRIEAGYISESWRPIKCETCGNTDFIRVDEYSGPYGTEEYSLLCPICNKVVGHWAYGAWRLW